MRKKVTQWFRGLIGGAIGSGCSAVAATFGLAGAEAMGAPVRALDFKQFCAVFISGAVVSIVLFLKQSPLPPESGNTTIWVKDEEDNTNNQLPKK